MAEQKTELSQFPRRDLKSCLELGKKLLDGIGDSQVEPTVAATTIGYGTLNGAAMTTLGALKQYGLIERPRGKSVRVSTILPEVLKTADTALLTELAYRPAVFRHLKEGNYATCTDAVVMKHLQEQGLTVRAARDAVDAFRANLEFLGAPSGDRPGDVTSPVANPPPQPKVGPLPQEHVTSYTFPLATCDVTLMFSGGPLGTEDMAILRDHLDVIFRTLSKRQRKQVTSYTFPLVTCDVTLTFSGGLLGTEDMAILREHLDVIIRTLSKRQK